MGITVDELRNGMAYNESDPDGGVVVVTSTGQWGVGGVEASYNLELLALNAADSDATPLDRRAFGELVDEQIGFADDEYDNGYFPVMFFAPGADLGEGLPVMDARLTPFGRLELVCG